MTTALSDIEVVPLPLERFPETAALIERAMHPGAAVTPSATFPLLLGPGSRALRYAALSRGRVVSHAAALPATFVTEDIRLPVALVGGVVTDAAEAGRGHATRVLRALLAEIDRRGIRVSILWTDREPFYARFGFVRAGLEILHVIGAADLDGIPERPVRRLAPEDLPAVAAIHDREPARLLRSADDWRVLAGIPACDGWILDGPDGPASYAFVGRGIDLQGVLHEWGGDDASFLALARGILRATGRPEIVVMSPPWRLALSEQLRARGVPGIHGSLGMIRFRAGDAAGAGGLPPVADPATVRSRFGDEARPGRPAGLAFYVFGLDSN